MEHRIRTWPSRLLPKRWLAAFVPINAATAGFGVVLPLLILVSLHGTWAEYAVAASLFNAAVIVASIFWGWVADRTADRRALLLVNYAGFALLYLALALTRSIPLLDLLYVGVGILTPAGTSASNLLVLETFGGSQRPGGYAALQEMSMIGAVLGLFLGYAWLQGHGGLAPLLEVLGLLCVAAAIAVALAVPRPSHPAVVRQVGRHLDGLASRIIHSPAFRISIPYFPHRPRLGPDPIGRFRRWVREEVHHELPLVFAAVFLFNLSSNLFNISYTPYLYSIGIGTASIFLVNLGNNVAQGVAYPVSGGLTTRAGPDWLVQRSTYVRAIGYLAVAALAFGSIRAGAGLSLNLVAYAGMGAAIALYSTASSTILFRTVEGRDAGRLLGLNSALGGLAAVGGAVLSGLLAVSGSYRAVFVVSGVALLASLPIWTAAHLSVGRRSRHFGRPPPVPAPAVAAPAPPSGNL